MKHYNLTVSGKVQGVFYRASTKTRAVELGLKGFVKNQANGTVYIEVEGAEDTLDQFINWCNQGPVDAVVSHVNVEESGWVGFKGFEVRYF